jgi:hypothetical protein
LTGHAALGLALHTGWAVAVAVRALPALDVLERRRLVLVTDDDTLPRFVYHAAAERDAGSTDGFVDRAQRTIRSRTDAALGPRRHDLAPARALGRSGGSERAQRSGAAGAHRCAAGTRRRALDRRRESGDRGGAGRAQPAGR